MKQKLPLPLPSKYAIRQLGTDIRAARIRRRITTQIMSERMGCTQTTLRKIEKGNPETSMGNYARALFVLGLTQKLCDLVNPITDQTAWEIDAMNLPKRVRFPKQKPVCK